MNKWKYTLNLKEFYHDDTMSIEDKATNMVAELQILQKKLPNDGELEDIIDTFSGIDDVDELDYVMNTLYDWADFYKVWIETQ